MLCQSQCRVFPAGLPSDLPPLAAVLRLPLSPISCPLQIVVQSLLAAKPCATHPLSHGGDLTWKLSFGDKFTWGFGEMAARPRLGPQPPFFYSCTSRMLGTPFLCLKAPV